MPVADGDRMMVQVRLDRGLMKTVDHYSIDTETYRAEAIERLLRRGLEAERYTLGNGVVPDRK